MTSPNKERGSPLRLGCLIGLFSFPVNLLVHSPLRNWLGGDTGWPSYVAAAICGGIAGGLAILADLLISRKRRR